MGEEQHRNFRSSILSDRGFEFFRSFFLPYYLLKVVILHYRFAAQTEGNLLH